MADQMIPFKDVITVNSRSAANSISSSVVNRPKLNLTEDSDFSSDRPMTLST